MRVVLTPRAPGELPIGAFAMLPLFALPLGAYLVESNALTLPVCGLKQAVGLPCLSCGATRATLNLLHGNLFTAISYQPMVMLIYVVLIVWGIISTWALVKQQSVSFELSKLQRWLIGSLFLIIPVVNWFYLVKAGI